jgi:hypothetical protein
MAALERAAELVIAELNREPEEGTVAAAAVTMSEAVQNDTDEDPNVKTDNGVNENFSGKQVRPTMALAAHLAAWPEGEEAKKALIAWCEDEGVPPPSAEVPEGHRPRVSNDCLGFGLITRPISAGSKEWLAPSGQEAIAKEFTTHNQKGTWDLSSVKELDDVVRESRSSGEKIIIGGVHPILGAKRAEKAAAGEAEELRCRCVFTAPRAWSPSALDITALYNEVSAAPVTFQGSRTTRAYGAMMGFINSSRDAKSAYLQSQLRRPGSNDPTTWIAIPRQYWPAAWHKAGLIRPVVMLVLSLYGHPIAGNRWELQAEKVLIRSGFVKVPQWKAIYQHPKTKATLGVYVDDFELQASEADTPAIWKKL